MNIDLSKPWTELPHVVCDFETDGPDPETCQPVELAVVRYEGSKVADKFVTLLDHGKDIDPAATAVHGITREMVIGSPRLEDVAGQIARVASGAVPVAYNSPFDKRVLHRFVSGSDVPLFDPTFSWLDVYVIVAKVDKFASGSGRHKLSAACERHKVTVEGAHRALADCIATHALLTTLHITGKINNAPMSRMLEHTDKLRREQQAELFRYKISKWAETASTDELIWCLNAIRKQDKEENAA